MQPNRKTIGAYIVVLAAGVAASVVLGSHVFAVAALVAILVAQIAMNTVRIRLDERFSVPSSDSVSVTGEDMVVLWLSGYIFGTAPVYVYSGGREIAVMYRGSGTTVLMDADAGVRISRDRGLAPSAPLLRIDPGRINLISEERGIGDFHVRPVDSLEHADERMMKSYYDRIKFDAVEKDLTNTCMMLAIVALLITSLAVWP